MSHTACVIFAGKRDLGFFFPSPEAEAVKESGLSEQEPSAQCKALSERKQMSFHPSSGGRMSGTSTGATYGTDRSVSVLALSVWATSRLGDVFCKPSFLPVFNRR